MQLETTRLHLCEFTLTDWSAVQSYCGDPIVVQYMPFGPNTVAETQAWLQWCVEQSQAVPRRIYSLAIILQSEARLIGNCTLALDPTEPRTAAFSYLLNRTCWGQGYATEAMRALRFWFQRTRSAPGGGCG
jgi:ribosomal-protein-alanine N-acetyltransferase